MLIFCFWSQAKENSSTKYLRNGESEETVTINWTQYGIPHIVAKSYQGLGFGHGYTLAKENICVLADQVTKIRAERSRYFGHGKNDIHIQYDFAYKVFNLSQVAIKKFKKLSKDVKNYYVGMAKGYNSYVEELREKFLIKSACEQDVVIKKITPYDLLAYAIDIGMLKSGRLFISQLFAAIPPHDQDTDKVSDNINYVDEIKKVIPDFKKSAIGSNAWAIGKKRSNKFKSILLGNPHLSYDGELKFYELHLKIPGEVNVYGASLYGLPGIQIGFNENISWTHTASPSAQYTLYRFNVNSNDHYSYESLNNKYKKLTKKTYSIWVKGDKNKIKKMERTFYFTEVGPVVNLSPHLKWNKKQLFALKDLNGDNFNYVEKWFVMAKSKNLSDFTKALANFSPFPWFTTIFAGKSGQVLYADTSAVPNISPEGIALFNANIGKDIFTKSLWASSAPLLEGNKKVHRYKTWVSYKKAPKLITKDYVFNSNNSYWISNLHKKAKRNSPFYGRYEEKLDFRSRMALRMLTEKGTQSSSGLDHLFTLEEVKKSFYSNRTMMAELHRKELAKRCSSNDVVEINTSSDPKVKKFEKVSLVKACDILKKWDGRFNLDSQGAPLFREYLSEYFMRNKSVFAHKFDKKKPLETPYGLLSGNFPLKALGYAIKRLETLKISLDSTLGETQFVHFGHKKYPIFGGMNEEGAFNLSTNLGAHPFRGSTSYLLNLDAPQFHNKVSKLTNKGYMVNAGSTFVFIVGLSEKGPKAMAVQVYSQSSNSKSDHFNDQFKLYTHKKMRDVLFTDEEIHRDSELKIENKTFFL